MRKKEREREQEKTTAGGTHICSLDVLCHRTIASRRNREKRRQIFSSFNLIVELLNTNKKNSRNDFGNAMYSCPFLPTDLHLQRRRMPVHVQIPTRREKKRKENEITVRRAVLTELPCDRRRRARFLLKMCKLRRFQMRT